jgi:hypothetical protein
VSVFSGRSWGLSDINMQTVVIVGAMAFAAATVLWHLLRSGPPSRSTSAP